MGALSFVMIEVIWPQNCFITEVKHSIASELESSLVDLCIVSRLDE